MYKINKRNQKLTFVYLPLLFSKSKKKTCLTAQLYDKYQFDISYSQQCVSYK